MINGLVILLSSRPNLNHRRLSGDSNVGRKNARLQNTAAAINAHQRGGPSDNSGHAPITAKTTAITMPKERSDEPWMSCAADKRSWVFRSRFSKFSIQLE